MFNLRSHVQIHLKNNARKRRRHVFVHGSVLFNQLGTFSVAHPSSLRLCCQSVQCCILLSELCHARLNLHRHHLPIESHAMIISRQTRMVADLATQHQDNTIKQRIGLEKCTMLGTPNLWSRTRRIGIRGTHFLVRRTCEFLLVLGLEYRVERFLFRKDVLLIKRLSKVSVHVRTSHARTHTRDPSGMRHVISDVDSSFADRRLPVVGSTGCVACKEVVWLLNKLFIAVVPRLLLTGEGLRGPGGSGEDRTHAGYRCA